MNARHAVLAFVLAMVTTVTIAFLLEVTGVSGRPLLTLLVGHLALALVALGILRMVRPPQGLPLRLPGPRQAMGTALLGLGALLVSASSLARLYNFAWGQEYVELLKQIFTELHQQIGTVGVVILTALFVPLCEELLFRGVVQRALRPALGPAGAIFVAATLFGLFHGHPVHALVAFLLGLAAGYALEATGTLWAPFLVHAANNGAAILSGLGVSAAEDRTTAVLPWWVLLPAVLVLTVGGWLVRSDGAFRISTAHGASDPEA